MALVCVLVDDDDDCRELYGVVLEMNGWRVLPARNGAEAFDLVAAHDPDLVITDLAMPHTDGVWLFDQVRQRCHTRPPILVITGQGVQAEALNAAGRRPTVCQVLLKPVYPEELASAAISLAGRCLRRRAPGAGGTPVVMCDGNRCLHPLFVRGDG
jgi:DNA-binding response OmpR family regulator